MYRSTDVIEITIANTFVIYQYFWRNLSGKTCGNGLNNGFKFENFFNHASLLQTEYQLRYRYG